MASNPLLQYKRALRANLNAGQHTEHTHRPALKSLIEQLDPGLTATNEPGKSDYGAPDYSIARRTAAQNLNIGYVEAKQLGTPLDPIHTDSYRTNPNTPNGRQLKRYREALQNLLITNYLDFKWYRDGEHRLSARLAAVDQSGGLARVQGGEADAADLLNGFLAQSPIEISNPEDLAKRMARLAHLIRDIVVNARRRESSPLLHGLHKTFRQVLIPSLSTEDFADMYAQTLTYGLFAARIEHDRSGEPFTRTAAAFKIPRTNPFLRRLFSAIAGPDLEDEPYVGIVNDLVQTLDHTDVASVLERFGRNTAQHDPVVHFYETFLRAYDPEIRELRGVYYTPAPVVSYVVRSVDRILKKRFDLPDGLADSSHLSTPEEATRQGDARHRALILDPSCGTGAFLYSVIDLIRERIARGNLGLWTAYVKERLLPRLFGFELLMAPYAVAHLRLAMQLAARDKPEESRSSLAYDFASDDRLQVYLTNSLDEAQKRAELLMASFIADEANEASRIKRDLPVMVVLGNPPYSGHSANDSRRNGELTWIGKLIEDYKSVDGNPLGERNPKWLQDDYVKFIRFGQWRIDATGAGVLAFVTNHGYLENPTFRGMRASLMKSFDEIYLLDLHGNARRKETAPDSEPDQNVFDIQQGVAIGIFIKRAQPESHTRVLHADLWGNRDAKYQWLHQNDVTSTEWKRLEPESPQYLFSHVSHDRQTEYRKGVPVTEMFPISSVGIVTARDKLTIQWSRKEMMDVVRDFASLPPESARDIYTLGKDAQDWKVQLAQDDLNESSISEERVTPVLYRPFDTRYTYYTGRSRGFICRPRLKVMRHVMAGENMALCIGRAGQVIGSPIWDILFCTNSLSEFNLFRRGGNNIFPLYIYPSRQEVAAGLYSPQDRRPNLSPAFVARLQEATGLKFIPDERGDLRRTIGPKDIFHYVYAILHSPTYRRRYADFLKNDFPRIPETQDRQLFADLAALGENLVDTHLLQARDVTGSTINYPVPGSNEVEPGHPRYIPPGRADPPLSKPAHTGRVYLNAAHRQTGSPGQYFENIPPEVWDFTIGGYRVCEKWLRDRRNRSLAYDEIQTYKKIVESLGSTIRLMSQIDGVIQKWPMT